jgi:DNA polymerase-3 subunit alpha
VKLSLEVDDAQYWSVHTHSRYSHQDALPTPAEIVARAKALGYQGLGLTDHGNMAGSIELYRECMKAGIKPFPGSEMYLVVDRNVKKEADGKQAKRYHLCLVAYTSQGYRNLIKISTDSHKNFHNKPLIDLADLARYHEQGWSEGIALTTGCYFGLVLTRFRTEGYEAAKAVVASLASWFDTYVEIQNHCITREGEPSETEISDALVRIATELDLPVLLTQDSHYVMAEERAEHTTLKRLVSFGSDLDDAVFPGDGFHLVDDAWMRGHHTPDAWALGAAGLARLLSRHDLRIPEVDTYDYRVPAVSATPDADLRSRCFRALADRGLLKPRYLDRFAEELEVIEASGMANYLLLVASVCDFMRGHQIHYQTRGSAAGSLVVQMLGISNVDPLRWGCRADRFLSKDRTSPPDVDLDVDSRYRNQVKAWIDSRYSVAQIGTWGVLGMSDDPKTPGKGSLKVKYFTKRRGYLKAQGKKVPWPDDWDAVDAEDKAEIAALAKKEALSGYGTHTCALVLVNSRTELESMVPMMWVASSKTMVTQYTGKVIESIGLIKLDLLGSKTMSVVKMACDNIGMTPADLDKIPFNSPAVFRMICDGDTDGFYQMEGATTKKGCKEVKPKKISEVIDIMALFRPGVMKSGAADSYIDRKFGREDLPKRHDLIARHTDSTRGILLYQDQIIAILRDLGMDPDDLTRFLKAVKASNKNVTAAKVEIDYYMPIVERMCRDRGMGTEDWDWLQGAFTAFAEYSFNVAHATVYGITAYQCAYLAVHSPVHFHAALLAVAAGTDKEVQYLRVTRRRKVKVKGPDLNGSGAVYRVDPTGRWVRKGFRSIDGIGPGTAPALERGQPYIDWEDFVTKSIGTSIDGVKPFKKGKTTPEELIGTVKALYEAGAFEDSIGNPPFGRKENDTAAAV